jgi:hypothetical protein
MLREGVLSLLQITVVFSCWKEFQKVEEKVMETKTLPLLHSKDTS